ncbi:MAG: NADH-quinone oxidoreductase subunit NuoE [Desulfuromonas sp.]|nr:MAG: NADH-quinone oxidoreductase subunit NuoE [Desulfuromonas sp.]
MSDLLTTEQIEQFRRKASELEHPKELVIDLLRAVQENHCWVPDEGVELVAEIIGVPPVEVEEVATFYDKIFRQPVGKKVIHICDSICCWSRGGEELAAALQQKLGVKFGGTTDDGIFTLLPSCCLGACGEAPAIMIGLKTYGNLTPASVEEVLAAEREESR